MKPTVTFEDHNLGDQMIFLHLLRSLARTNPDRVFWHCTHAHHLAQLNEVIEDLPNIELFSFESAQWRENRGTALNVWKNSGATDTRKYSTEYQTGFWERSKNRWDWSAFTLEHHAWIAKRMGLESPFTCREHLLFDYPRLTPPGAADMYFYDFLICNSEPCSGQFGPMQRHGTGYLDDLAKRLAKKYSVITTQPVLGIECTRGKRESVSGIGRLSILCRNHICVATGPFWGTMNTTNHHHSAGRKRIVLLDNGESLNMPGIEQRANREEVEAMAKKEGWL